MGFVAAVGRVFIAFLTATGRLSHFTGVSLSHCVRRPIYFRLVLRQMVEIGYYSLPVVGLTAVFTGMVLALQSHTGFSRFNAESAVATVVVLSITRELAPVLAGLMVAGRIGAADIHEPLRFAVGIGRVVGENTELAGIGVFGDLGRLLSTHR